MQAVPSSEMDDPETKGHPQGITATTTTTTSDNTNHKLVVWQGVALLTADCLGVGVLALPNDVSVLGYGLGLSFLILNFPINYFAGDLLSAMALQIENGGSRSSIIHPGSTHPIGTSEENDDDNDYGLSSHEKQSDTDDNFNDEEEEDVEVEMTGVMDHHEQSPMMVHRRIKTINAAGSSSSSSSSPSSSPMTQSYGGIPKVPTLKKTSSSSSTSPIPKGNYEGHPTIGEMFQDEPDVGVVAEHNIPAGALDNDADPIRLENNHDNDPLHNLTADLIGISKVIFHSASITHFVILIYYMNLFLVLGDYILVMGRAVSALCLDRICLPTAGAIASVFMFGICQFRTMALLGRNVSMASLLAMMIVLGQCLFHHRTTLSSSTTTTEENVVIVEEEEIPTETSIWAQFSALASIGFAVGSQKLFLNIRHELQHKHEASRVLAGSLTTYGVAYIFVIVMAGANPPSFMFDAIPQGWSRQVAGLLLWAHVAVSFAINSQALCSSMDRFIIATSPQRWATMDGQRRWFLLTLTIAVSSYLVSNAVPFFKDLVALIGALTSVPLTLTLPALLYRQVQGLKLFLPQWFMGGSNVNQHQLQSNDDKMSSSSACGSYSLLLYSLAFLAVGLAGALSSIDEDWLNHGRPFSCR